MVVPSTTVYLLMTPVLAVSAVLVAGFGLRRSGTERRMLLIGAIPATAMAGAYLSMGLEIATVSTAGREQSVMRFVGYTFSTLALAYLVHVSIGPDRRQSVKLYGAIAVSFWFSFASWLFTGALKSVITLSSLVLFGYAAYLLFGPIARAGSSESGERRLFFAKIRNLFVLCYGALVLLSVISEQVLGLADAFVGAVGASYVDTILMCGIGVLVVTSAGIFAESGDTAAESTQSVERASAGEASGGD